MRAVCGVVWCGVVWCCATKQRVDIEWCRVEHSAMIGYSRLTSQRRESMNDTP